MGVLQLIRMQRCNKPVERWDALVVVAPRLSGFFGRPGWYQNEIRNGGLCS